MRRWTCWTRSAACVRLCQLSQRAQSGSDPLRNAAQETRGMWHAACGMWHAAFAYFGGQTGSHLSIGSKRCNKGTGNTAAGTNICKSNGCHSHLPSCHAPKLNYVLGNNAYAFAFAFAAICGSAYSNQKECSVAGSADEKLLQFSCRNPWQADIQALAHTLAHTLSHSHTLGQLTH